MVDERTQEAVKAIMQVLADNGFTMREANETLEAVKYCLTFQKVQEFNSASMHLT